MNRDIKTKLHKHRLVWGTALVTTMLLLWWFNLPYFIGGLTVIFAINLFLPQNLSFFGYIDGLYYFYSQSPTRKIYLTKTAPTTIVSIVHWHGYDGDSYDIFWDDGVRWHIPIESGFGLARIQSSVRKLGFTEYRVQTHASVLRSSFEERQKAEQGAAANP